MPDGLRYDDVQTYLSTLVPARAAELQAMEQYADEHGFPIIGPAAGYLCYQVARMVGAQQIFELGSGYGYSTAWFAQAVEENGGGQVHHVVWDRELSARAKQRLDAMGYDGVVNPDGNPQPNPTGGSTAGFPSWYSRKSVVVRYHVGEAVDTLRSADGPFDLIFNDIDKEHYPASLEVLAPKLRPGGVLIIDNMLWGGAAFDGRDQSPATQGVREVTRRLAESDDWIASLVPVRDGLIVAMKR